jgi:hypothetical protein
MRNRRSWIGYFSVAYTPLAVLVALSFYVRSHLPPWAFMLGFFNALLLGYKWRMLVVLRNKEWALHAKGIFNYLGWLGIDAEPFFTPPNVIHATPAKEWRWAFAKIALGAGLIWGLARLIPPTHVQMIGWVGVIGFMLLIHFGVAHVMTLMFYKKGINVLPFMREPMNSQSLNELWGKRWGPAAFSCLMRSILFRPLSIRFNATVAFAAVFVASGVMHELLMSVPVRGGYGIPMAYFVLQIPLYLFGGSLLARKLRIDKGLGGRIYTLSAFFIPLIMAFYLHPFFPRLLIPMMHAVHAL